VNDKFVLAGEVFVAGARVDKAGTLVDADAAVEVRAQVFYPMYDQTLRAHGAGFSVAAISKDEDRHLEEMTVALGAALGDWRPRLEPVLAAEEALFSRFLGALEKAAEGPNG